MVRSSAVWLGYAGFGEGSFVVRRGSQRLGLAWSGAVRFGLVWLGGVRAHLVEWNAMMEKRT